MPRANWGVSAETMDEFDRSKQFKPYTGPVPPVGSIYQFVVKILKHQPPTQEKNASLGVGLELEPRNKDEKRYAGFFVMTYLPIADNTQFRYVPFLDAIGVSTTDFERRTITDEEGNIKKIGPYRHTGDVLILAKTATSEYKGNTRNDVDWFGEVTDAVDEEYDAEDLDPDEYDDEPDEEAEPF